MPLSRVPREWDDLFNQMASAILSLEVIEHPEMGEHVLKATEFLMGAYRELGPEAAMHLVVLTLSRAESIADAWQKEQVRKDN